MLFVLQSIEKLGIGLVLALFSVYYNTEPRKNVFIMNTGMAQSGAPH